VSACILQLKTPILNELSPAFNQLKTIEDAISPGGVVYQMIKADIEVAEQLETMRRKGGRRDIPIPKQF
jgi:hypothetical protein